jgi:uncharacterized protein YoxC
MRAFIWLTVLLILFLLVMVTTMDWEISFNFWIFQFTFNKTQLTLILAITALILAIDQLIASREIMKNTKQALADIKSSQDSMDKIIRNTQKTLKKVEATQKAIKEVSFLDSMSKIVIELSNSIINAKEMVLFLASSPAVGISGAKREYDSKFQPAITQKLAEFDNQDKKFIVLSYSIKDTLKFYREKSVPSYRIIEQHLITLAEELQSGKALYYKMDYCNIPFLHFCLTDPNSRDQERKTAIMWYLQVPEPKQKVSGIGFKTTNSAIIDTLCDWFCFELSRFNPSLVKEICTKIHTSSSCKKS